MISAYVTEARKDRQGGLRQNCRSFITWFRDNNCDKLPAGAGNSAEVYVLPFTKISQFYLEYDAYMTAIGDEENIASLSTFRRAYANELKATLRTMRCKGNFSHSCGICNGGSVMCC